MQELSKKVPVVDTIWLDRFQLSNALEKEIRAKGWTECVIKPSISASGMHTKKFNVEESERIVKELSSLNVGK